MARLLQEPWLRFAGTGVAVPARPKARGRAARLDRAFWLAGFSVRSTRSGEFARFLRRRLASDRKIAVGFVNQNFVISCRHLTRNACGDENLVLVNDGIGMQLAALLRFGRGFRENLNGTDFVPRFLQDSKQPLSVYLLGSEPAVVARAAAIIGGYPACRVVGHCDGFSLWGREAAVLADIAAAAPDVLLVGLGNPVQERWVLDHWPALNARIVFGVGALFEWISGHRRRAPRLVRRLYLEWLYRLLLDPRRLYRRYTIGILSFFALVLSRPAAVPRSQVMP